MVRPKKIKAALLTFTFVILGFYFATFFTDHPVSSVKKTENNIAAFAIRDNVIALQKYGTRLFSMPYLQKHYASVSYFTQGFYGEHHKAFVSKLQESLARYDSVDMYLLAHSNTYYTWIEEIDSVQRSKIRLVYNTGCSGAYQAYAWKRLGVKYYVAHESSQSISPVFYFYFLRRYTNGYSINESIKDSNEAIHEKLFRIKLFSLGLISIDKALEDSSEAKLVLKN